MSRSVLARWRLYLTFLAILALVSVVGMSWREGSQPERIVSLSNVLFRLELAILVDYPKAHNGAYPPDDWNQIKPYFSIDVPDWFWRSTVYNVPGTNDSKAPLLLFADFPGKPHGGSVVRFPDGRIEPLTFERLNELRPKLSPTAYQRTLDLMKSANGEG